MTTTRREFVQRSAAGALALSLGPLAANTSAATRLTPAQLSALRDAVRGTVYSPGSKGYDSARKLFNTRFDGIDPPAVVRVRDTADVQSVIQWASRYDIPLVSRSGGNAYNGSSTSSSGVVVDVGGLDGIALNSDGIATLGPGARLLDVYATLAKRGATIPAGSCPNVAVGGHALGGGMGLAGRSLGLTLDRIQSITCVTADGQQRTCTPKQNADLFWALRGGGGSFAIVTSLRLRAKKVRSAAYFQSSFPASSRAAALDAWQDLMQGAPTALTTICTLTSGRATIFGQYLGSQANLSKLVAPLRRLPGASVRVGTSSYLPLMERWAGCSESESVAQCSDIPDQSFDASSIYVAKTLSSKARSAFVSAANTGATLVCDSYGGKIDDVAPTATAFVHREVRFSVQIVQYAPISTARKNVNAARKKIAPYGTGAAYQNYCDLDLSDPLTAYYGANLTRLREIKQAVDPDDRFQITQGIRP